MLAVSCSKCRRYLYQASSMRQEDRQPCPHCGSTARWFGAVVVDPMDVQEAGSRLEAMGRRLEWTRCEGSWLVEGRDGGGSVIDSGIGDDPVDALLGVAERLLPPE